MTSKSSRRIVALAGAAAALSMGFGTAFIGVANADSPCYQNIEFTNRGGIVSTFTVENGYGGGGELWQSPTSYAAGQGVTIDLAQLGVKDKATVIVGGSFNGVIESVRFNTNTVGPITFCKNTLTKTVASYGTIFNAKLASG